MSREHSVNIFSTPPVSFQYISRFVGGAKSSVVIMSDVLASWLFISSPEMFFTSSTISLRLRFAFVTPLSADASTGASAKLSSSLCSSVVWSGASKWWSSDGGASAESND